MTTHAKLFIAATVLLAIGLVLGFWPIYADETSCGAAFSSGNAGLTGYGEDVCGGKVAALRYPAVILLIVGVAVLAWGSWVRNQVTGWSHIRR